VCKPESSSTGKGREDSRAEAPAVGRRVREPGRSWRSSWADEACIREEAGKSKADMSARNGAEDNGTDPMDSMHEDVGVVSMHGVLEARQEEVASARRAGGGLDRDECMSQQGDVRAMLAKAGKSGEAGACWAGSGIAQKSRMRQGRRMIVREPLAVEYAPRPLQKCGVASS
jgi:hypothetical protein